MGNGFSQEMTKEMRESATNQLNQKVELAQKIFTKEEPKMPVPDKPKTGNKEQQQAMPEAISSVTFSLVSPSQENGEGYPLLFTARHSSVSELLDILPNIYNRLKKEGYKPNNKRPGGYPKKQIEYVPGKQCPQCKGRLVKGVTKANKPFEKCENKKFDYQTKKDMGTCAFIDYLDNRQPTQPPAQSDPRTPPNLPESQQY